MNTGFVIRSINIIYFISKDDFVTQYQETMGKTARNEKLTFVLSTPVQPLHIYRKSYYPFSSQQLHPARGL